MILINIRFFHVNLFIVPFNDDIWWWNCGNSLPKALTFANRTPQNSLITKRNGIPTMHQRKFIILIYAFIIKFFNKIDCGLFQAHSNEIDEEQDFHISWWSENLEFSLVFFFCGNSFYSRSVCICVILFIFIIFLTMLSWISEY